MRKFSTGIWVLVLGYTLSQFYRAFMAVLSPVLREELWTLFHQLADSGVAVFVSSHVMDEAERCDRLLLMREGRIIADGSPDDIKQRAGVDDVEAAFLAIVRQDRGDAS